MNYKERIEYYKSNKNTRVEKDFTYHPPTGDQIERFERLRNSAKAFAYEILICCPNEEERELSLTRLEDVLFWANAAIARNGDK